MEQQGNQMPRQAWGILVEALLLIAVLLVGVVDGAQSHLTQEQEMQGVVHFKAAPVVELAD
jgi:hypothetical protein